MVRRRMVGTLGRGSGFGPHAFTGRKQEGRGEGDIASIEVATH